MDLSGVFRCPQCGGKLDKCRPSGPERVFAVCFKCSIVFFVEDFDSWKRRMEEFRARRIAQNAQYGSTVLHSSYFEKLAEEKKKKEIEREKDFNPTER